MQNLYAFPMSFAQQRLWFIDRLAPGNPFYNLHVSVPIDSAVKTVECARALNEVVRRHESLRTTFCEERGVPVQIVQPSLQIEMPVIDVSRHSHPDEEALRIATGEAGRPFVLSELPLLRAALVKLREDRYVFLLTMHHIIADGWSMGVFFDELRRIYGAFATGQPSSLDKLPIQYADFAIWQRDWLQGEELEKQLAYWREQLRDLPTLDMPTDFRRPSVASFRGSSYTLFLPASLTSELKSLSRRENATLFMTLLAAFKVLLHRYSGQNDITVGSPIANRNRPELERLIGFFVNTLVLRTDLSDDPTFRQLLARVRAIALGAYEHQDLPFEKLVEELRPERDLSRNPLFQILFQLHNTPTIAAVGGDSAATPQPHRGTSNFDLAFALWESREGLMGQIDYCTDLFGGPTIERLAGHYRVLLEGIVADVDRHVSELPLITDAERKTLVVDWNETGGDYPLKACVHDLFEERVERSPDAVALIFEDRQLTYRQLNRRANRLARALERRGVVPGSAVGVCVERSLELIIALLAILKAGGAYVGLDAGDPVRRLAFLAQDAAMRTVVTQSRLAGPLEGIRVDPLRVEEYAEVSADDDANPRGSATAEDLAYIAYTSGSTGTPKGVCVCHRAVVRLVMQNAYVQFGGDETFFQFSPLPFDASTFEIWGSLLNGARLAIHPHGQASLEELGHSIERHSVTTLWLTAGLFHQMVDHQLERLRSVRQLLTGGDVLSAAHVRKALEAPGERVVVNGYGPTEATTFTACHRMTDPAEVGYSVPIGRPISGTRVYVLDRHGNPVPIGVRGELYVGGDGVARGYLNAPELTSQKFVPDHLTGGSGCLYRTGDGVRWRGDGVLEFLGRIDRQVKVRGFRVEPSEIEGLLCEHPSVRNAAVVVRAEGEDKRLVAYIEFAGAEPSASELRMFLQERAPTYLIPSDYVPINEMPLTHNGKVDERRLPEPVRVTLPAFIEPSTEVERTIAAIWTEVLGSGQPSVDANFFTDLGGHSLLATQVVSRIRGAFGVEVPLRSFFEAPTISGVAAIVEHLLIEEIETLNEVEARGMVSAKTGVSGE